MMNVSSDAWHFAVNALQLLFPFHQYLHVKENDSSADLGSTEKRDPYVVHRWSHPRKLLWDVLISRPDTWLWLCSKTRRAASFLPNVQTGRNHLKWNLINFLETTTFCITLGASMSFLCINMEPWLNWLELPLAGCYHRITPNSNNHWLDVHSESSIQTGHGISTYKSQLTLCHIQSHQCDHSRLVLEGKITPVWLERSLLNSDLLWRISWHWSRKGCAERLSYYHNFSMFSTI